MKGPFELLREIYTEAINADHLEGISPFLVDEIGKYLDKHLNEELLELQSKRPSG